MICRAFDYELDRMLAADQEDLSEISGIGDVIAGLLLHISKTQSTAGGLRIF